MLKNQVNIEERSCESLKQFLHCVADEVPDHQQTVLLWRGQSDASWGMDPSLARVWKDNPPGALNAEKSMFDDFSTAAPYLMPASVDNDWDKLSIAQHYGMNTRLLDWTVNPLQALWFALAEPHDCNAAVWLYRPDLEKDEIKPEGRSGHSPFEVKNTKVFQPARHSQRVAMQGAWHTVHRCETPLKGDRGLRGLDSVSNEHRKLLKKYIIPREYGQDVFRQLESLGVSVTNVYGDLASLCRHLSVKFVPPQADR